MLNLTEEQWNNLFDEADKTVCKAIDDLPLEVQKEAEKIECIVDKYQFDLERWKGWKILGTYMANMNGPIVIFVGQIYEDNDQDMTRTMASVRQVYYHELAHAIGDLSECEVKERGL